MMLRGWWIGALALAVVSASFAVAAQADDRTAWIANLSGANEVPARPTQARGVAHFLLSEDAMSMSYILIAANIENVVAAHIHVGPPGVNGPVVVTLFIGTPGSGRFDGVLAMDTFDASDFSGPLAGHPWQDLLDNMTSGNAYVNVHTNDGVAPTNTGAGDFPGGEIRGQLRLAD